MIDYIVKDLLKFIKAFSWKDGFVIAFLTLIAAFLTVAYLLILLAPKVF